MLIDIQKSKRNDLDLLLGLYQIAGQRLFNETVFEINIFT